MSLCILLGGGGHCRIVVESLRTNGIEPYAILDSNSALHGSSVAGVPIRGDDDLLPRMIDEGADSFLVGLGGVGDNRPRARLFERGLSLGLTPIVARHSAAYVSADAKVGHGTVVFPAAVINAGAIVGANVIVNSGAIVEHDCVVGNHVHIASGSILCSTVQIGDLAHVGAGAVVRQVIRIGEGAVVGAGAVVVSDVPSWTRVAGVPARQLR